MGELIPFFTELSNDSRLAILFLLFTKKLNLTQISQRIALSMPETSRHLSRLAKTKFVRKDTKGYYHLSQFGYSTLIMIPGFSFITKNKDYILTHSFLTVPPELMCRIGELKYSVRIKKFMSVLELIELCIRKAEKRVFMMSDQIMKHSALLIEEKVGFGLEFESLFPESYNLPIKFVQLPDKNVTIRTCEEITNFILLTERETILAFPNKSNTIDYNDVFYAQDESSLNWSKDFIINFFENSKQKAREIPTVIL